MAKLINSRRVTKRVTVRRTQISAGDFVEFLYKGEKRLVLVLNQNWDKKLHGISINDIAHAKLRVLLATNDIQFLDAETYYDKYKEHMSGAYRTFTLTKLRQLKRVAYKL